MQLTTPEVFLIWRSRLGLTQVRAAKKLKMSAGRYWRTEAGRHKPDRVPLVEDLKPYEVALVLRRRAGKTQAQLAQELGCCRWWLNQMERGIKPHEALASYWKL